MSQLRHQQKQLDEFKIQAKLIAFDNDVMAKAYAAETDLDWPLLLDRDRQLYKAYGMGKGSWWALMNPVSIAGYVRLILTGTKLGKPGEDVRQMGGDILIDPNGIVQLHHVSTNPHDRPSVEDVLDKVTQKR